MGQDGRVAEVRGVLFDYGLVLTGPPEPGAWRRMREVAGMDEERFSAAYWVHRPEYDRGGLSGRAYWDAVVGEALDGGRRQELIEADTRLWTQANQPMIDWALRLQGAGTPTGILSNLGDEMMAGVMGTLDWMHGFPVRVFSHEVGVIKPTPAIYAHAAREMGLPPAEILFVDDREENVAGAFQAGMQAVQYREQEQLERELAGRGLEELWAKGRMTPK